ncbi:hypothetical protein ACQ9BC_26180, partial [Klebsiella quasipneumoniae]
PLFGRDLKKCMELKRVYLHNDHGVCIVVIAPLIMCIIDGVKSTARHLQGKWSSYPLVPPV